MNSSNSRNINANIPQDIFSKWIGEEFFYDGDLFPWNFKTSELDTDIRVPFFTNYDAKSDHWIVENHGVDPGILIDNDPIRKTMGQDQQLEMAIEVALEQLKKRQPLPSVPAPRTFKDLGL